MKRRWLSLLLAACVALAPAVTYASDAQHPGGRAETIIISGETTPTDEDILTITTADLEGLVDLPLSSGAEGTEAAEEKETEE